MSGIQRKRYMNLCLVLSSLQKYFEIRGRKINFFTDAAFEKLGKALDLEMKVSARNSIGSKPKQAEVSTQEMAVFLWEKKIFW